MADMTVANTILAQLGGSRFLAMTGAKNLTGAPDRLTFGLPRNPGKVTHISIVLMPTDLYRVTFYQLGRRPSSAPLVLSEETNVYAEDLRAVFTDATKLETSLGTMGVA